MTTFTLKVEMKGSGDRLLSPVLLLLLRMEVGDLDSLDRLKGGLAASSLIEDLRLDQEWELEEDLPVMQDSDRTMSTLRMSPDEKKDMLNWR